MQIVLKYLPNEDGLKEWAMIELQGEIGSKEESSLDGQFVGDLYYNRDGVPIFIIGHHILFGKVQKLDKPFAVLEKVNCENIDPNNRKKTEYIVKAIIKRKLCFRDRPKPIVGCFGVQKAQE